MGRVQRIARRNHLVKKAAITTVLDQVNRMAEDRELHSFTIIEEW
jgi:hypothetical protein